MRLRLINTDQTPQTFAVQGAPIRVAAIDGMDVASDTLDRPIPRGAGGGPHRRRARDARLRRSASESRATAAAASASCRTPATRIPELEIPATAFDPLAELIAGPTDTARDALRRRGGDRRGLSGQGFDVERTLILDRLPRIVQGMPNYAYTVDGRVYPYIEPTVVDEGDTVRMRLVNRSFETHPMHPHGHAVRVLSVNGRAPTQPLWLDTFDVRPGEVWEVALYADNPGIWMDHCHNLEHAALGMVTHLAYRGITTPYDHGGPADNAPE